MSIYAFGPSSSLSGSLDTLFIHLAFSLCFFFFCAIFLSKIVRFLLHPVFMFWCHLLPVVDRIFFHCLRMSCFICIVLPFFDISLIFQFSPVLFGLFPHVVLFFFSWLPFPFCLLHIPSYFLCFIILACFRRVLSAFQVEIPILVLFFLSCFFRWISILFLSVGDLNFINASTWFTLLISPLTVLHSKFLNDGKVIFLLFKIL